MEENIIKNSIQHSVRNTSQNIAQNNVKSVIKAFAILEALDRDEELSISEMASKLAMDKTTVHRIVNTIKEAGFVNQNPITKKYSNSMKFYMYGRNVLKKNELGDIARPYIKQIAKLTHETVNLGILVENSVVYIDRIQSEMSVQVATTTGRSIPLYCTGMGKAVLAFLPEKEMDDIISSINFVPFTKNTIISGDELKEKLVEVREKSYSIDYEESEEGLIAFGAPIFSAEGMPFAAISISCPKTRFDDAKDEALFARLLTDAAAKISAKLGHEG